MIPICISTVHGKCLQVMLTSITEYCPGAKVYLRGPESVINRFAVHKKVFGSPRNFGDDYNEIMDCAFADGFDSVICGNDDIVLTPTSYSHLMEDVDTIKSKDGDIGWVAAKSDAARPVQNVRSNPYDQKLVYFKYPYEDEIMPFGRVAPIFSFIERRAWNVRKFPPLNWYSDDVHCVDLESAGFKNYLSRSYVHHVGSQTVGFNADELTKESIPWIRENRPKYAAAWFS